MSWIQHLRSSSRVVRTNCCLAFFSLNEDLSRIHAPITPADGYDILSRIGEGTFFNTRRSIRGGRLKTLVQLLHWVVQFTSRPIAPILDPGSTFVKIFNALASGTIVIFHNLLVHAARQFRFDSETTSRPSTSQDTTAARLS